MKSFRLIKALAVALVALASLGCGNSTKDFDINTDLRSVEFVPDAHSVMVGAADYTLTFRATLFDGSVYSGSLSDLTTRGYNPADYGYTLEAATNNTATGSSLNPESGTISVGQTAGLFDVNLLGPDHNIVDTFRLTVAPAPEPERTITSAFFHGATLAEPQAADIFLEEINDTVTLTFDVTYSDNTTGTISFAELREAGYTLFLHYDDGTLGLNYDTGLVTLLPDHDEWDYVELYAPGVTPQPRPGHDDVDANIYEHDPRPVSAVWIGIDEGEG